VIIEHFRYVLRLRRYEKISIENRFFCTNGISLAQNFSYKESSLTDHSSCQKARWMTLLYDIRILALDYCVLSQSTRLIDRQTDRRTDGCWQQDRVYMHSQSQMVKMYYIFCKTSKEFDTAYTLGHPPHCRVNNALLKALGLYQLLSLRLQSRSMLRV